MTTQTTRSIALFQAAFTLCGIDGELPAGSYRIETEEEVIESLSFVAFRRLETTIELPAIGSASLKRQIITIDPLDLAAAQLRDAARS
ncbi:hypothetical protein [Hyphomicrobium sp. LHD-15]|uniref:hypothetical protein n=1 Tax=Hyphomicrobium sp. LHD-15 TaxID=3072142 RepID=UPI0028106070|nr:hypothetical protein [Hyphomicrobium sp. LHD-15]MDQ8698146.1 hypothetical protein [Hyphomicrobium sp. LHD-15]